MNRKKAPTNQPALLQNLGNDKLYQRGLQLANKLLLVVHQHKIGGDLQLGVQAPA